MADIGVPLEVWNGSDATRALEETTRKLHQEAAEQAEQMIRLSRRVYWLTWALVGLTIVMLATVIVQVVVALR